MHQNGKQIVFVVDDDESVRRSMKRLLRSAGFDAETFASAEEFLRADCSDTGACVIADAMMPGLGGVELCERLIETGSKLPVILVTAYDTAEAREHARRIGVAGYFRKPVDDQALLDAIQWALERGSV